ncbi:MAG: 16S rRNA (cytosine(1402)-N(4))-methyltransferase RsmH [Bacteroidales bacterium]|nr:16S rRNA (cytosine(1402)-N(4))-methyltransferase RsmH [Bacteroidales bacterium]
MEYHLPVLLEESVEGLNIKPNGVYVDATFGGGGHSREILGRLNKGKLLAFDQDEDALENIPDDKRFIFVRHNFRFLKNFLRYYGIHSIDGLLADLGVSSHHFDSPHRGFSFRFDSELDMRMNTQADFSAKELVNTYGTDDLARIFRQFGELKNAGKLANTITAYRKQQAIVSIREFLEAISPCLPKHSENQYLAKVFQAIRIEVNKEITYLKEMLGQAADLLNPGGRLVVISYHSLEDRVVKNFFRNGSFDSQAETDLYGNILRPLSPVNRHVIVPNEDEINRNNRARSARLRIAEKL